MKKQLKEAGKYLVTGGVGLAVGVALTWNGSAFLDDIGNVVDQLVNRVANLEGDVDHYSDGLDLANEQIRQANRDTLALHQRVNEAIANIEGVYLEMESDDLEVE